MYEISHVVYKCMDVLINFTDPLNEEVLPMSSLQFICNWFTSSNNLKHKKVTSDRSLFFGLLSLFYQLLEVCFL